MKKPLLALASLVCAAAILLMGHSAGGRAVAVSLQKNIEVSFSNIKILLNGAAFTPKDVNGQVVEPFIYQGTTYVPLRPLAEAFYRNVEWDAANNLILLTNKYQLPALPEELYPPQIQFVADAAGNMRLARDYPGCAELTSAEMRDKLGWQLFSIVDAEKPFDNPYLLYADGEFSKLPVIYPLIRQDLQFTVADINGDGAYELLYTLHTGFPVGYHFLFARGQGGEISCPIGTVGHDFTIQAQAGGAALVFADGNQAALSLSEEAGGYTLTATLADNAGPELKAALEHAALVKARHAERSAPMLSSATLVGGLHKGMSDHEVYELLGLPSVLVGSGEISDGYDLGEGFLLLIYYDNRYDAVGRGTVYSVLLRDRDGSRLELVK